MKEDEKLQERIAKSLEEIAFQLVRQNELLTERLYL